MKLSSRIQTLTTNFIKEKEKTLAFFQGIEEDSWSRRLYTEGSQWTVHQVLAHIVEAEGSLFILFNNILNGGAGVGEDFDIDRYNGSAVEKISSKTTTELLALFEERRKKMIEFVRSLSPKDLEIIGRHPWLGISSLGEMLRLFLLHINLHIRDIRKAIR